MGSLSVASEHETKKTSLMIHYYRIQSAWISFELHVLE